MVNLRRFCRLNDLLVRRVQAAVTDVLHDGAAVKPRVLQNHAEFFSEVAAGKLRDVLAVKVDPAGFKVVEAHEKLYHSRFACTRRADNSDFLACFHIGGEIVDDSLVGVFVAEANVVKANVAADIAVFHGVFRCFFDDLGFIKEIENALCRRHGALYLT